MMTGIVVAALVWSSIGADVTYSLATPVPLLDQAFYDGEASDGSNVAGRMAFFGCPSNDGQKVAFIGVNADPQQDYACGIFLVTVGAPSSWRRIVPDQAGLLPDFPVIWSPDSTSVMLPGMLVNITTGVISPNDIHGFHLPSAEMGVTALLSNNWVCTYYNGGSSGDLVMLPILNNGREDLSRDPVRITKNLKQEGIYAPEWPHLSADGTKITFFEYSSPALPSPDTGDVYVIANVQAIMNAPRVDMGDGTFESTAAIDGLADPNLIPIRTTESSHYCAAATFSQDGSLAFWEEDYNDKFNDRNFFATLFESDFDVMLSAADGSGEDIRFQLTGNQGGLVAFPGGVRLLYLSDDVQHRLRAWLTSLETQTSIDATTDPLPEGETTAEIGGQTVDLGFTLTDAAVQTSEETTASDSSGTTIELPDEQVINFPPGELPVLSITTPVEEVTPDMLPPDDPAIAAIPVVREFGPEGTEFYPPVSITISYTDAEVAGLNEASLTPYLYNTITLKFDTPVLAADILHRDLLNNTITFRVDHFSKYGLAGYLTQVPVASSWGLTAAGLGVLCIGILLLLGLSRREGTS